MPAVIPEVENLVESVRPALVILPNSSAPLAHIEIGGPQGSQFDNGDAGRGGGGSGSLLTGGNAPPVVGSIG